MENFWIIAADLARGVGLNTILIYPRSGQVPRSIVDAGIQTTTHSWPGTTLADRIGTLRFLLREKVRAIYLTDRPFTSWFYLLARLCGTRVIIVHDHAPGDRPPVSGAKGLLKSLWRRIPLCSANIQFCVSPLMQTRAILNGRIPPSRTMTRLSIPRLCCRWTASGPQPVRQPPESRRMRICWPRAPVEGVTASWKAPVCLRPSSWAGRMTPRVTSTSSTRIRNGRSMDACSNSTAATPCGTSSTIKTFRSLKGRSR